MNGSSVSPFSSLSSDVSLSSTTSIIATNILGEKPSGIPISSSINNSEAGTSVLINAAPLYYVMFEYGLVRVPALYDPGAQLSMIKKSVLLRIMRNSQKYVKLCECSVNLSGFNDSSLAATCAAEITFAIAGHVFTHSFLVLDDVNFPTHDCLIGQDFWHKNLLSVDTKLRLLVLKGNICLPYSFKEMEPLDSYVKVQGSHIIKTPCSAACGCSFYTCWLFPPIRAL